MRPIGGKPTPIVFAEDHDQEDVLRTFLDENPQLIEAKPKRSLTKLIRMSGPSWSRLASEVLSDYYEDSEIRSVRKTRTAGTTQECPLCGAEVAKGQLPTRLVSKCPQ